jgi:hypothetical protein
MRGINPEGIEWTATREGCNPFRVDAPNLKPGVVPLARFNPGLDDKTPSALE